MFTNAYVPSTTHIVLQSGEHHVCVLCMVCYLHVHMAISVHVGVRNSEKILTAKCGARALRYSEINFGRSEILDTM